MEVAIDTETTGLDFHHGAKPFIVTVCYETGLREMWRWEVDPYTRCPEIPSNEIEEIVSLLSAADKLIMHNAKFDIASLNTVLPDWVWDYSKIEDTSIAGHVLRSDMPHNLTDMVSYWIGTDIEPYEQEMKLAVRKCRSMAPEEWSIAKAGRADMPSAKSSVWKYDLWVPFALDEIGFNDEIVKDACSYVEEYSFQDKRVVRELKKIGLYEIYKSRMELLEPLVDMESHGITASYTTLHEDLERFREQSAKLGKVCTSIASRFGADLVRPKSGINNSLRKAILTTVASRDEAAISSSTMPTKSSAMMARRCTSQT